MMTDVILVVTAAVFSAMYVLSIRFFGEPIQARRGLIFGPGRVYSQRPDARRAGVMRLDHTTRDRGPHLMDAGSHKTFRHGITVERLPLFSPFFLRPSPDRRLPCPICPTSVSACWIA